MTIILNEPPNTPDTPDALKKEEESLCAEVIKIRLKLDLEEAGSDNQTLQNSDRGHDMIDNLGAGITDQVTGVPKGNDPVTEEIDSEVATPSPSPQPRPLK